MSTRDPLFPHPLPAARELLQTDNSQRIQALRADRWIDYPRAIEALGRLQELVQTPRRERMPCMLLHGPSNIGKSQIIAKFLRENPPSYDKFKGVEVRPVVSMQMPPAPDQKRFYRALLEVLGVPQSPTSTLCTLEHIARDILKRMSPQMLVVDEVHHLLAGSAREQRASLNLLKYLANEVKMSIVAVGTNDAPVAFQADAQIHSRFRPLELPRWTESDDFRRLLAAFELVLPLRKASNLQQRPMAQFILTASGGLLGEVSRLLTKAAEVAISTGTEQLSLELLESAAYGRR
jgi:Bacterial TniB protein